MNEATIEVAGLRKRFGRTLALDGITATVSPGQVTGFIGPTGAGMSTTMRVILGLDKPDEGTALIGGRPYVSRRHPLTQIGALLDASALQPSRTARNHLLWLAHSQGLASLLAGSLILPGHGIGPVNGYPAISFQRRVRAPRRVRLVIYLTLIALLSLAAATALREAAVAIGAVLGLLYVLPIIAVFDGNATLTRHLEQIAPMTAGMAIQGTTGRSSLPISPWAGLGVLAAWAAGALIIGGMLLRSRDA